MQALREVSIENFRSCIECDIALADFTPMVGYNNGGKSNILDAIQWLLEGFGLNEGDFYAIDATVSVAGIIEGIDEELLGLLIEKHRSRIQPFCREGRLKIRRTQSKPSGYKRDVRLDVWDPNEAKDWARNPAGIDQAISALFPSPIIIGAMENATEDVGKSKSTTTIGKLIAEVTEPIADAHGPAIQDALDNIGNILEAKGNERAPELVAFDDTANEMIEDLFPGISVALHVPPPEIHELFKVGTIKVHENDSEQYRDVSAMGHGAQRLIQMALVRYLADVKGQRERSNTRTLLLIDEPELYLHPQAILTVRSALRDLARGNYQVIFSTHSPQMVGINHVSDTLIIRKSTDIGTHPLPTVREAVVATLEDARSQANTLFEFANASQVLFSDRVLIAEGKAEGRLLPSVGSTVTGIDLSERKIALVEIGSSTSVWKALQVLEVIGIPARAVVDLDFAFRAGISAGVVDATSEEIVNCKNLFQVLADERPIELAPDGFPKNGSELSAEESFAILGADERAAGNILAIHEALLEENIWLWPHGSLEHHLGLSGKGEEVWGEFIVKLNQDDPDDLLADPEGIGSFFEWLLG